MHYPKISIVTPAFNAKGTIAQTIESVLGQGYPNLEYIVMDGASTDGSAQMIETYANELTYWQSQSDGGQYDAINQGFAKSSGEIMCWLNADDKFLTGALFVVADIFSTLNSVEWISSLQPASWDANGYLAQVRSLPGFSRQAFLDGLYLPTTTKKGYWLQQESSFWRRSLWDKAGAAIPNYALAGDFALWCRFYEFAQLHGVSYPLGGFRMMEGQRSEDHQTYMAEATQALKEARTKLGWQDNTSSWLYSSATQILQLGNWIQNRMGYEGAFINNTTPKNKHSHWEIIHKRFLP
jgi:glycosyltransferase involved in cell wall biosynthesis